MAKKILTSIAFFLISVVCFAQATYLGIHGGATAGWFSGDNWDNSIPTEKPAIVIKAGLFFERMFSNHIGIVTEVNYTSHGKEYTYTYSGVKFEGRYTSNAFEIPILVKFASSEDRGIYTVLGPSLQFLQGDMEFKQSGGGYTTIASANYDTRLVLGAIGGIGYRMPISSGVLNYELRYGENLTYPFNSSNKPFDIIAIELLVGYGFVRK